MKNNKKSRPTEDQLRHLDFSNSASATECTGLVTHFATDEEIDAYMDVYNFQATPGLYENEKDGKKDNIF